MAELRVPGRWLHARLHLLGPDSLVGAVVVTARGESLRVARCVFSQSRDPLMDLVALPGTRLPSDRYRTSGFDTGYFVELIPAPEHAHVFAALFADVAKAAKGPTPTPDHNALNSNRGGPIASGPGQRWTSDRQRVREQAQQERQAQHSSQANETMVSDGAQAVSDRALDLLIFDLDDTLINTGPVERYRGMTFCGPQDEGYVGSLSRSAGPLTLLIPEDTLLRMRKEHPGLRMAVFTRSPRTYTQTLLQVCYPQIRWDVIVAFEDVEKTKPHPVGIRSIAQQLKLGDRSRVALVGDSELDIIAAYQAGILAVLFTAGWGPLWNDKLNPLRAANQRAAALMPDARIDSAEKLHEFVRRPHLFLPCLESWALDPELAQWPEDMRVESNRHFNPLDDAGTPHWVETLAMGRYFPFRTKSTRYNFGLREASHSVSRVILDAKSGKEYPDSWVQCCANYISGYAKECKKGSRLVVCVIPSSPASTRPEGAQRMADFLQRLATFTQDLANVVMLDEVLQYLPGGTRNKGLGRDDRFRNIRDHLVVALPSSVRNQSVLVIDDVCTSGATFFYAHRYLLAAGAVEVRCLALTQTIS